MHVLAAVRDSKITDHHLIEGTPEPRSAWAGSSCQRQNPADNSPRPLPGDGNVRVALFELPPETPRVLAFSRVASHMAQKKRDGRVPSIFQEFEHGKPVHPTTAIDARYRRFRSLRRA